MHRQWLPIVLALGPSCGAEPAPTQLAHEALLQRLDAMEKRLDLLEDAQRPHASPTPSPTPPLADAFAVPDPIRPPSAAKRLPATLQVTVTATGLELDGKAVDPTAALARFREVARLAPSTRLTVLSEPDVPYSAVVEALDLAREAGLTEIAMSARIHGAGEGAITAGP